MRPAIVAEARRWTGTPYVYQAACRGAGADCFGLVRGVWRACIGPEPWPAPDYAPGWGDTGDPDRFRAALALWFAQRPAAAAARPGDVLLFRIAPGRVAKHLGVRTDGLRGPGFVHAHPRHGVIESPLGGPWARRVVAAFAFPASAAAPDTERNVPWQP